MTTTEVYITDKSGERYFNTLCCSAYAMSEVRNLEQKIKQARQRPDLYHFLDVETASVMVDGECGDYFAKMTDDELLAELMA